MSQTHSLVASFNDEARYKRFKLEGYLDKQASHGVGVRWQTRYFRVVDNFLVYTDTKESSPADIHKTFDLNLMNENIVDDRDPRQFLVGFKNTEGLLHLRAATQEDCARWVKLLSDRQSFLEEETLAKLNIKQSAEEGQAGKPQSIERATIGLRFAIDNLTTRRELSTAMEIAARAGIGLKSTLYSEAETKLATLPPEDVTGNSHGAPQTQTDPDQSERRSVSSDSVPGESVEQSARDQFFNALDNAPAVETEFEVFLKEIGVGDYAEIASLLASNGFGDIQTLATLESWKLDMLGVPEEDVIAISNSELLQQYKNDAATVASSSVSATEPDSGVQAGDDTNNNIVVDDVGAENVGTNFAKDLDARTGRATVWRCLIAGAHVRDKPGGAETRRLEMGEIITQHSSKFAGDRLWIAFYDKLHGNELRWTVTTDKHVPTKLKLEPLIESKHSALVSKGANVEVKYGGGVGNWTKAIVLAVNADDTLRVRYRDGEVEKGVHQEHVRVSVASNGLDSTVTSSDAHLLRNSGLCTKPLPVKDRLVKGIDYDSKLTALLLGNSNVGKSSMMQRYVNGQFYEHQMNTIGIDHREVLVEFQGHTTKLAIWDTAGQERFAQLSRNYVRRMDCLILCFDITNKESFEGIGNWTEFLQGNTDTSEKIVFLVGTKSDLSEKRVVLRHEGESLARSLLPLLGEVPYYECSAKDGNNINTIFEALVPFWHDKFGDDGDDADAIGNTDGEVIVGSSGNAQPKKKCC
mgnify:CR=1 FL=1